jgi:GMP synthase (glutamine-hydrolysing)
MTGQRLRLLVVEGNTRESCRELAANGAVVGAELYRRVLRTVVPDAAIDIVHPADADGGLPTGTGLGGYDGVVVSGSGLHVYDDDPAVTRQIDLARAVLNAGVPFFGSCWALHIAVVAAGGTVRASPRGREMGFARKIALTEQGRHHPLFEGRSDVFDSFAIHFDEVTHVPPGSVVLAANGHSAVQALSMTFNGGEFWGLQYHPEYDLPQMAGLIVRFLDFMVENGFYADRRAALAHVELLKALDADPGRRDLAWLLGIDDDILDERLRYREIGNWLTRMVLPGVAARH